MTHPWFRASRAPRVLAHRGFVPPDAEGIVENTLAAFAAAHAAGTEYVESDCHLTADGTVVLFHDPDLSRITGDPRPLTDVGSAELARVMAARGGLATVSDALESFPALRFTLDVKADAAALPFGRAIARHADRVLVASFSDARRRAALEAARAAGGHPATSAGTATIARTLAALASRSARLTQRALTGIDALQIPERRGGIRILSERMLNAAHEAEVEVHVWTVNDPTDMARLLDAGVDGIITDRTDLAVRAVAARR